MKIGLKRYNTERFNARLKAIILSFFDLTNILRQSVSFDPLQNRSIGEERNKRSTAPSFASAFLHGGRCLYGRQDV